MSCSKVNIDNMELIENEYQDQHGNIWCALKLIEHSKKYKPFKLPLIGIDLTRLPWDVDNISTFIHHAKRIKKTSLKHPIILDDEGMITDGWHRVAKAILKGETHIKAIRLETMPTPDRTEKSNEE